MAPVMEKKQFQENLGLSGVAGLVSALEQMTKQESKKEKEGELVQKRPPIEIHRPTCLLQMSIALDLYKDMLEKEEWNKEKLKLQEIISQKDEEIEKKNKEIIALQNNVDNVITMIPHIVGCRTPPRVYVMYLKELDLSFKLSMIIVDLDHSIETPQEFYQMYQSSLATTKNLLCEFYLHNYPAPNDNDWNPLLYIGDIHIRSLMSWIQNENDWG